MVVSDLRSDHAGLVGGARATRRRKAEEGMVDFISPFAC